MLFYSFFKTLTGQEVTVELKNDLEIRGILHSVDQYLNVKLEDLEVVTADFRASTGIQPARPWLRPTTLTIECRTLPR